MSVYLGSSTPISPIGVDAIHLGTTKVWPTAPPLAYNTATGSQLASPLAGSWWINHTAPAGAFILGLAAIGPSGGMTQPTYGGVTMPWANYTYLNNDSANGYIQGFYLFNAAGGQKPMATSLTGPPQGANIAALSFTGCDSVWWSAVSGSLSTAYSWNWQFSDGGMDAAPGDIGVIAMASNVPLSGAQNYYSSVGNANIYRVIYGANGNKANLNVYVFYNFTEVMKFGASVGTAGGVSAPYGTLIFRVRPAQP